MSAPCSSGLDSTKFVPFTLKERVKHNHNTDLFVFSLADDNASANLPVSSCVLARFTGADGKEVMRPYTPINQSQKGVLNLLVKEYPQGNMSKHIHQLNVGDKLEIKGPLPKLKYESNKWKRVAMVCGGTGITPMLQILDELFSNPADETRVVLLYANQSERDVLLREKIENDYVAKYGASGRFQVVYIFDRNETNTLWCNEVGFITRALLEKYLPPSCVDNFIYTCGPPRFMELISGDKLPDKSQGPLTGFLKEMGFDSTMVCKL